MGDDDPQATFGYVAAKLNADDLAYLHLVNPNQSDAGAKVMKAMRKKYRGTLIVADGFDREKAAAWLQQGKADLIAFGRSFLANPDLPSTVSPAGRTQRGRSVYLPMVAAPKATLTIPPLRRWRRTGALC